MLRLGTRPDNRRTSWPPVESTSRSSPLTVDTEFGTSRMFSERRSAVTVTSSNWTGGDSCADAVPATTASDMSHVCLFMLPQLRKLSTNTAMSRSIHPSL